MNLLAQLKAVDPNKHKRVQTAARDAQIRKLHAKRRAQLAEKYKKAFDGQDRTTSYIAKTLNLTHMGCLTTLYELERRKLVIRMGLGTKIGPGKKPVIWRWNNEIPNSD